MRTIFKKLREGVEEPQRAHLNDAGYDVKMPEDTILHPGKNLIPMGFSIILPPGICALLTPRSSWMGEITNSAVPIDPGYSGEWHLCINNLINHDIKVLRGERIAQIVFLHYADVDFVSEEEYKEKSRGNGGLGSTGK